MREVPVSSLSRQFILKALAEGKRTDGGRRLKERRDIQVQFGAEWGCCLAVLGGTKVLAQTSCSVTEPRATRPNEGQLLIQVNFSPMCAPRFAEGAPMAPGSEEEVTEVSRIVERVLKESRCLDMESLCIIVEEKVWCIRLDVHVLNHEGNVSDCAGVAGLAALAHFKRPDATVEDGLIKIYSTHERDPIPLAVHHFPVCSTFAFFKQPSQERIVVSDPSHEEEAIMDGKLVLGVNPNKEICTLHLAGHTLIHADVVVSLAAGAVEHARDTVNLIKNALAKDGENRKAGKQIGLSALLRQESVLAQGQAARKINVEEKEDSLPVDVDPYENLSVTATKDNVVDMIDDDADEEIETVAVVTVKDKQKKKVIEEVSIEDDESEEEEICTLSGKDNLLSLSSNSANERGWYQPKW